MDRLEERLRRGLAEDVDQSVAISLESVRAGARRRVRRTGLLAAACAVVVGVAAGVTAQQFGDDGDAAPATPELPDNAVQGVVDVSVSYDAAEDRLTVYKLTTNIGCVGCSTVWRQDSSAEDGWERVHDVEAPEAERNSRRARSAALASLALGPLQGIEFAANGLDGYAWSISDLGGTELHATHDGGQTWATVEDGPRLSRELGHIIGLTSTDAWLLSAQGSDKELWRSSLGSDEWTKVAGFGGFDLTRMGDLHTTDHRVVLEGYDDDLRPGRLVSSADGVNWTGVDPACQRDGEAYPAPTAFFFLCPSNDRGATIYRTTDFATWQEFGVADLESVNTVMPLSDFQVLLIGDDHVVLMSTDGSTEPIDLGLASDEFILDTDTAAGTTFAVTYPQRRILTSTDGGQTWTEVD